MPVDMFLKIDDIKGESKADGHKEEIQVNSWDWGISNSGTTHVGSGGGSGKASVRNLRLNKPIDSASHALLMGCVKGTHFKKATLVLQKSGGAAKPLVYLKIEMEQVLITSVEPDGSGGNDGSESVELNFSKVKFEYTPQKDDGTGLPVKTMNYDIARNTVS